MRLIPVPVPSLISLTGLLSFMLSDEMTTGSVTSTEAHKRVVAARTHNWNISQPRFREAFPEVGTPLGNHCHRLFFFSYSTAHQQCVTFPTWEKRSVANPISFQ